MKHCKSSTSLMTTRGHKINHLPELFIQKHPTVPDGFKIWRSFALPHSRFAGCSQKVHMAKTGSVRFKLENYKYVNQLLKFPFALDWSQDTKSYTPSHAWKMSGDFLIQGPQEFFTLTSRGRGNECKCVLSRSDFYLFLIYLNVC